MAVDTTWLLVAYALKIIANRDFQPDEEITLEHSRSEIERRHLI